MSKRIKALFCVETAALLAAVAWILVLLFPHGAAGIALSEHQYQS